MLIHPLCDRSHRRIGLPCVAVLAMLCWSPAGQSRCPAEEATVAFDIRPAAAAVAIPGTSLVKIDINVSAMTQQLDAVPITQWTVQIVPRQIELLVHDYAPRTEVQSNFATPIGVKKSKERTLAFGLSGSGPYGAATIGKAGVDQAQTNVEAIEYQEHAPVHAVTASGTIQHGRGVYFQLRGGSESVLVGEKRFELTMAVPTTWRGGLLDVSVVATHKVSTLGGLDTYNKTIAQQAFVVAVYPVDDADARQAAWDLAAAERSLRSAVASYRHDQAKSRSLPGLLHSLAGKFDGQPDQQDQWLQRLLSGKANPYSDREIKRLPADLRVIAIAYNDSRIAAQSLSRPRDQHTSPIAQATHADGQLVARQTPRNELRD